MNNEYVKLGDYIDLYDELNSKQEFKSIDYLQGINNEKYFQECQSNKNDIDLFRYRICRHGMFSYNKATSRNGEKISIAYRDGGDCLVSPSYVCFSIKDEHVLMHEYLLLFFKRPVFDRYVRFNSWGSATEFFTWQSMKDVRFKLPSIDEQKRIVSIFNKITDRISLLNILDEKLLNFGKQTMKKIYNSSDAFNGIITIEDYCEKICSGGTPSRTNELFWSSCDYPWMKNGEVKNNIILDTEEYISQEGLNGSSARIVPANTVSMAMYCVSDVQVSFNVIPLSTNQAVLNMTTDSFRKSAVLYFYLASFGNNLTSNANGSAQQNLSKDYISAHQFKMPNLDSSYFDVFEQIINYRIEIARQIQLLNKLEKALIKKLI